MECQKLIVDCDAGSDDALALIILIAAHKQRRVEILAITCVAGNTELHNVINNVFRVLHVCDALNIPVYKGADSALLSTDNYHRAMQSRYHGLDGFGDVHLDMPDISRLKNEHAVYTLQSITAKYYGEVTLVCLAPLTNIALTIKMYPDFMDSVRKVLVMGGNLNGVGNITSQAEFNFYYDPESVHIVMSSATKKLWMLPWEATLRSTVTQEWRNNVFGKINTPVVELMNMVDGAIDNSDVKKFDNYLACDAYLAAIVLRPDIARDIVMHHVDIELGGHKTRGQVVIDHLMSKEPNAFVIQDIDSEIFKEILLFAADPNKDNSHVLL